MIFLLIALSKMGLFKNDEFYFYSKKKIPEANKQHPPPKKKQQNKTKIHNRTNNKKYQE